MPNSDVIHLLSEHLQDARKALGSPSLRTIAARTDYSHTTVAKAFTVNIGDLSWPIIEQIGAAVEADPAVVRQLWAQTENGQSDVEAVTHSPSPSAQRLPLVLLIGALVCAGVSLVVMQTVDTNHSRTTFITDLVVIILMVGASAMFIRRFVESRRKGDRRNVVYFALMTAGVTAWGCGQIVWSVERTFLNNAMPEGYLHDIGFLLMPICIGVALGTRANLYGLSTWRQPWHNVITAIGIVTCPYALTVLLLSALDLDTGGSILLYAIYPATDIALFLSALAPMMCGHRLIASALLGTGFLAAAASDIGYLLLRADPSTTWFPPSAALGYVVFAIGLCIYGLICRPLPAEVREPVPVRVRWFRPRDIVAVVTGGAATLAVVAAAANIWINKAPDVNTVMLVIIAVAASGTAALGIERQRQ